MISWILDFVPYWVWIIVVGIALAATYQIWFAIWLALPRWLKTAIIATASLGLVYLAGRNRGAAGERDRQKKASEQAARRREEIEDEIRDIGHADVDRRLNQWMRD